MKSKSTLKDKILVGIVLVVALVLLAYLGTKAVQNTYCHEDTQVSCRKA